jgi:hypothetical protein
MHRLFVAATVAASVTSSACAGGRLFARQTGLSAAFAEGERLEAVLAAPGCLWVTDADGTLWSDDIGEGFLKALIAEGALVSPEARGDVWAAYEERVRRDKASGYAWAAQQWLGRWAWRGAGLDLALLGGLALDQQGTVGLPDASALAATDIGLPLRHLRYGLLATTGAAPLGDWVLRWELALGLDRPFNVATPDAGPLAAIGTARHHTLGGALGLSWAGLPDTLIALEVAETVPLGASGSDFLVPPDLPQVMLRVTHRALRESLRLLGVVTGFGLAGELGWLARLDAGWAVQDGLEVGLGYMHYDPTDRAGPITGLDRHDRVSLRVRWDFDALGRR